VTKLPNYRPLPDCLTIQNSPVEGLGLFASQYIAPHYELGISHVKDDQFHRGYIRTPLGGFYNHSENPNIESYIDGRFIRLRTLKAINSGEELTGTYWLYSMP
jgi:hypothetical protein